MARYHEETRLTSDVIRAIAADLADLSREYEDIAEKMARADVDSFEVVNYKSLVRGISEIESHLTKTFASYQRRRRRSVDVAEAEVERPATCRGRGSRAKSIIERSIHPQKNSSADS